MPKSWLVVTGLLLTTACTGSSVHPVAATPSPTTTARPSGTATPTPSVTASVAARQSPGIAGVSDFHVADASFVSRDHGFALGRATCRGKDCTVLLESVDGARHWTARSVVPADVGEHDAAHCQRGLCINALRFVTPRIGYAFAPSLLMTTDGGATWQDQHSLAVTSLEGDSKSVLRIRVSEDGCSGEPARLESSTPGSSTWSLIRKIPGDHICPPTLYRQGHDGVVLVSYGNSAGCCPAAVVYTSTDRGRTLVKHGDVCQAKPDGDGYTAITALAPTAVLAQVCVTRVPTSYALRVSPDHGATYRAARTFPLDIQERRETPVCGLAAGSAQRLLILSSCGPHVTNVHLTSDGGRTWSGVDEFGPGHAVLLIGYQDSLTARTAQDNEIHTTTDGGRTWRTDHFLGT